MPLDPATLFADGFGRATDPHLEVSSRVGEREVVSAGSTQ